MKNFGAKIKTTVDFLTKPERPFPEKAIFWADQEGDRNSFPDITAIRVRQSANRPNPLVAFGKAVSQAQDRIWVVDQYFLEPDQDKGSRQNRVAQILNWMPETMLANDIKFLTKTHNTNSNKEVDSDLAQQFREHAETINAIQPERAAPCDIKMKFTLGTNVDFVHDRFAVIDEELWHFGATVGGFHSSVSAATRGWRASAHGAVDFFKLVWKLAGAK